MSRFDFMSCCCCCCCCTRPVSISFVLPLTRRPLRFSVNKMCVYCWEMLLSVTQAFAVHSRSFQGKKKNKKTERRRYFLYINTCYILLCWVHCFSSCLDFLNSRTFYLNSLPGSETYHMHIHFPQLVTVSQTSLNIGHTSLISIYKLLLCQFWDSQSNSTWIYANVWVSLCIWLAFGSNCQF